LILCADYYRREIYSSNYLLNDSNPIFQPLSFFEPLGINFEISSLQISHGGSFTIIGGNRNHIIVFKNELNGNMINLD
jgi:hypothetical protein